MNRRSFLSMIGLAPVAAVASVLPIPSQRGLSSFDVAAALEEFEFRIQAPAPLLVWVSHTERLEQIGELHAWKLPEPTFVGPESERTS